MYSGKLDVARLLLLCRFDLLAPHLTCAREFVVWKKTREKAVALAKRNSNEVVKSQGKIVKSVGHT